MAKYSFHTQGMISPKGGYAVGEKGSEVDLIDSEGRLYFGALGAGTAFYVDSVNGSDSNGGKSWGQAVQTVAKGIALSAANQNASLRNTIFIKGTFAANMTTLAPLTDIIGVGSQDDASFPLITGVHTIGVAHYKGCRFINVGFKSPAGGGVILSLNTKQPGTQFINCVFDGRSTTPATRGLLITAAKNVLVQGCTFVGAFSVAAIDVATGAADGLTIVDNKINSAATGIVTHSGTTVATAAGYILNNTIFATGKIVDDAATKFIIGENRGATGSNGHEANTFVYSKKLAYNNHIACDGQTNSIYPVIGAIPS